MADNFLESFACRVFCNNCCRSPNPKHDNPETQEKYWAPTRAAREVEAYSPTLLPGRARGQGFGGFVASPNKAIASDARLRDKQQNTREPQCPPLVSPSPEGHKVAFSFALGMPEAHLDFSCDPSCMEVPALALFSRGAFAFQRLRQESYRSASGVACVLRALSTALAIGNGYNYSTGAHPHRTRTLHPNCFRPVPA